MNLLRILTLLALLGAVLVPGARADTGTAPAPAPAQSLSSVHDFDFFHGRWSVVNRRLRHPLTGSTDWQTFTGIQVCRPLLGGQANYDELEDTGGKPIGLSLHLFDVATKRWTARWVSASDGKLQPPMTGGFAGDLGLFEGEDSNDGQRVLVRYTWSRLDTPTPRWEQAYSNDDGRTWETNWIMDYTRIGD